MKDVFCKSKLLRRLNYHSCVNVYLCSMKRLINLLALMFFMAGCSNAQSIEAKKFQEEVNKGGQLVDVRTPDEYTEGHISHAVLMDVNKADFTKKLEQLDKNKTVYVYCRSGKRSHTAADMMKESGFKNVFELRGGIIAWEEAGLPVEKGNKEN